MANGLIRCRCQAEDQSAIAGDRVEIEISGRGVLRNDVVAEGRKTGPISGP